MLGGLNIHTKQGINMKRWPSKLCSVCAAAILSLGMVHSVSASTTYKAIFLEKTQSGVIGDIHSVGPTGLVGGNLGLGLPAALWNEQGQISADIDPGSETYPSAVAVNSTGQALISISGDSHMSIWQNGVLTKIAVGLISIANSLNAQGVVAGWYYATPPKFNPSVPGIKHAFVWDAGQSIDLGILPGGTESAAVAINNNGQVAGNAITVTGATHAVLWRNGEIIDLGTLPGDTSSVAMNINDAGDVVGLSSLGTISRPFRWRNGVMTEIGGSISSTLFPANELSVSGSSFRRMNNAGQIVATQKINDIGHAVVWNNGVLTDLNPLLGESECNGNGINDAGEIVGHCLTPSIFAPSIKFVGQGFKLVPVSPGVDVGVTMSATPAALTLGQSVLYSMYVTNSGTLPANAVTLSNALPAGVSFVSASSTQGSCRHSGTTGCALGALAAGASATVQIIATPTVAGALINRASVTSAEADVNLLNNNASTSVQVTAPIVTADLGVTLTDSPDPVKRRSNLTYKINVKNTGPANASNVALTDKLPSSMTFVSASSSQGSCSGTTTVTCNLGTLNNGSTASVTIVVRPQSLGNYTNSVTVSTTTSESSTSNNTVAVVTTVQR